MVASNEIETDSEAGEPQVEKAATPKKGAKAKAKKTGSRSWRPAAPLALKSRDPAFRLKWGRSDPAQMMRARAEGWVQADPKDAIHDRPNGVEGGQGAPAGVTEYRDMVLLKMPEELARERDAYYREAAQKQLRGIRTRAKREIRQQTGISVEGEVTIE